LHRHNVAQEFNHPVRVNFFPGFSICLLLLSVGALPHSKQLAFGLWSAGAIIHFSFTLTLIRRWITRNFEINHSNPAWFIPVVGNVIVPITGVKLGYMELSWMFFSIGILFWLILFTIVFNRIIFHDQLPAKFIPTLFILIAPPSIGFISYVGLNAGIIDGFARILFYSAFFIGLLMATMWKQFLSVPFYISWWAYTFPLDALSIATLEMGHISHNPAISYIAPVILGITTVVVALVLIRTGIAIAKKTLFVPE
jgi:tellurite resistance protein